jgi:hypothetical protein
MRALAHLAVVYVMDAAQQKCRYEVHCDLCRRAVMYEQVCMCNEQFEQLCMCNEQFVCAMSSLYEQLCMCNEQFVCAMSGLYEQLCMSNDGVPLGLPRIVYTPSMTH